MIDKEPKIEVENEDENKNEEIENKNKEEENAEFNNEEVNLEGTKKEENVEEKKDENNEEEEEDNFEIIHEDDKENNNENVIEDKNNNESNLNDKLKQLAKLVKDEDINNYFSKMIELDENENGIKAEDFFKFLNNKQIYLNDSEKNEFISTFKKEDSDDEKINFETFKNKLNEIINEIKDNSILDNVPEKDNIEGLD